MFSVNLQLHQLLKAHGVDANLENGWLLIAHKQLRLCGAVVNEQRGEKSFHVQLDVRVIVPPGYHITESFAGGGEEKNSAIANALQNFASSSFHVLLDAFVTPDDPQVTRVEMDFGGRSRLVTLGNTLVSGSCPAIDQAMAWHRHFEDQLKREALGPGLHWLRTYCAQMKGEVVCSEVLLNNFPWAEMQEQMKAFDWPKTEGFYGLRTFLIVHPEQNPVFEAKQAVEVLADLIASCESFTEGGICRSMTQAGVPGTLASRVFIYTQVAWGRALLSGLGIRFSPHFIWLNGAGEIAERVVLDEDPIFNEALQLAPKYLGTPGFKYLAMTSAAFNSVNSALNAGSKPENLQMSATVAYMEPPTRAGKQVTPGLKQESGGSADKFA